MIRFGIPGAFRRLFLAYFVVSGCHFTAQSEPLGRFGPFQFSVSCEGAFRPFFSPKVEVIEKALLGTPVKEVRISSALQLQDSRAMINQKSDFEIVQLDQPVTFLAALALVAELRNFPPQSNGAVRITRLAKKGQQPEWVALDYSYPLDHEKSEISEEFAVVDRALPESLLSRLERAYLMALSIVPRHANRMVEAEIDFGALTHVNDSLFSRSPEMDLVIHDVVFGEGLIGMAADGRIIQAPRQSAVAYTGRFIHAQPATPGLQITIRLKFRTQSDLDSTLIRDPRRS